MSSDDDRVLAAAARLVDDARRLVPDYAGAYAPLRTDQVSALLGGAGCHVEVFPFVSDTVAMTLPRCAGAYPVLVNRAAERTDRWLAFRHEVAHVLAGDVEGAVFLSDDGCMALPERVADLFALADLVPGWWIADVRAGRTPWRRVRAEVALAVAEYAECWPPERLVDRVGLRVRLFRERGV
ncbi:MAG TPA: hypothetical protein VHG51_08785 [Longimicrobiaceae bacterium]|nr:hypothetical protein [Longimicrobiaceae bacterium]